MRSINSMSEKPKIDVGYLRLVAAASQPPLSAMGPTQISRELSLRGLKISTQQLGNWKTSGIPHKYILPLSEILGVSPAWLASRKDDPELRDAPPVPKEQMSAEEQKLLEDYRLLLEEDQHRLALEIRRLADIARAYREKFGSKTADKERVEQHLPPAMTEERARAIMADPRVQQLLREIELNKK